MSVDSLRAKIREVPDFPKPGILFYDITTLIKEPDAVRGGHRPDDRAVRATRRSTSSWAWSRAASSSARPWPIRLGAGFVPVRKLGKLPAETISVEYALEYGTNTLEVHKDAIAPGQRVLIVDDLLATGGTVLGTIDLVKQLKGEIVGLASSSSCCSSRAATGSMATTSTASSSTDATPVRPTAQPAERRPTRPTARRLAAAPSRSRPTTPARRAFFRVFAPPGGRRPRPGRGRRRRRRAEGTTAAAGLVELGVAEPADDRDAGARSRQLRRPAARRRPYRSPTG